jgi:hypothetical protein
MAKSDYKTFDELPMAIKGRMLDYQICSQKESPAPGANPDAFRKNLLCSASNGGFSWEDFEGETFWKRTLKGDYSLFFEIHPELERENPQLFSNFYLKHLLGKYDPTPYSSPNYDQAYAHIAKGLVLLAVVLLPADFKAHQSLATTIKDLNVPIPMALDILRSLCNDVKPF